LFDISILIRDSNIQMHMCNILRRRNVLAQTLTRETHDLCSRFCPLRHVPMDLYRRSWGSTRLPDFLDRLRCHLCRQPLAEATMRRPAEPGRIGPGDMLLWLRGLDAEALS